MSNTTEEDGNVSRRKVLSAAGAGVVSLVALDVALRPSQAEASHLPGFGHSNDAGTAATQLGSTNGSVGTLLVGNGANNGALGVAAPAAITGDGIFGIGVQGTSNRGYGVLASGGLAPLRLVPAGTPGPPASRPHDKGDVWVDSNGVLWVCVQNGIPGTWVQTAYRRFSEPGGLTHLLSKPIRLLDTRSSATSAGLQARRYSGGEVLRLPVTGRTVDGVQVPAGAVGLVGNVTVTGTDGAGHLALFPTGGSTPGTSSINYTRGATVANAFVVGLGGGRIDISVHGAATHVIVDATGFIG